MGCPVQTFRNFEKHVSSSYNEKDFTVVFFANAESPSPATKYIVNNFNELDEYSRDVNFYLPGYGIGAYNEHFSRAESGVIDSLENINQSEFRDLIDGRQRTFGQLEHGLDSSTVRVVESSRLGKIIFNPLEYFDFFRNFSAKLSCLQYMGGCIMIVLPKNQSQMPDYESMALFHLELLVGESGRIELLREFIMQTFDIIRRNINRKPLLDVFRRFHRRKFTENILTEINVCYNSLIGNDHIIRL